MEPPDVGSLPPRRWLRQPLVQRPHLLMVPLPLLVAGSLVQVVQEGRRGADCPKD